MADLSINFAGIKSPNPFWLASAPPTNRGSMIERTFDASQMGKLAAQGIHESLFGEKVEFAGAKVEEIEKSTAH